MPINKQRWSKTSGSASSAANLVITDGVISTPAGVNLTLSPGAGGAINLNTNTSQSGTFQFRTSDNLRLSSGSQVAWSDNADGALGSLDVGFARVAAGVVRVSDGSTGRTWIQQLGDKRNTANQTVTDSATLANSTDLTLTVAAGRHYRFRAQLHFTTINTSGVKVAIAGTATHTNIIYDVIIHGISTPAFLTSGRATAAGTAVGVTASGTAANVVIEGLTTINAGGTLLVQFAQNAETGAAESVILLRGSSFTVTDCA